MFEYRIWPDYTIQDAEDPPIGYMSDDYVHIWANSREEALEYYKRIYG